jgi:hypothetical protein
LLHIIAFAGAGAAEGVAVAKDFALEIDAFAALGTDDTGAFEAGKIFGVDFDFHPFLGEKNVVGELRVGLLLAFFFGEIGEEVFRGLLRGFFGGDADGAAGLEITESGGDLAPVAKFQGALAEAAVGDQSDSVGDAAVNLDEGDDAFALGDGVEAEFADAEHGKAHAEDLPGADMAVGDGGEFEVFGEAFHGCEE